MKFRPIQFHQIGPIKNSPIIPQQSRMSTAVSVGSGRKRGFSVSNSDDEQELRSPTPSAPRPLVPRRYVMAALCVLVNLICYADRTNIAVAILYFPPSSSTMDSATRAGLVLSAFYYGYLCTQILASTLAGRLGAKPVLMTGVLVWTLCDLSTVQTATVFPLLLASRIGMGLGSGVNFPSLHAIAASWFPKAERSRLLAIVSSGTDFGTILSLFISPIVASKFGWRFIFIGFSILNVTWWILFWFLGASTPAEDDFIMVEEKTFIEESTSPTRRRRKSSLWKRRSSEEAGVSSSEGGSCCSDLCEDSPWSKLIFSWKTFPIAVSHMCFAFGWYFLLNWLPKYLAEELDINLERYSILASLPYISGFVGLMTSGFISDKIIAANMISTIGARKLFNTIGFVGPAICLFILPQVHNPVLAISLLCLTLFMARFTVCGHSLIIIDVAPQHAGQLMGFCNTLATLPGMAANIITGKILSSTGSWTYVFWIPAALNIIGSIVFLLMAQATPIIPIRRYSDQSDQQAEPLLHEKSSKKDTRVSTEFQEDS
jgi:MFS family permease